MPFYEKRNPGVIEALQWTGKNSEEMKSLCGAWSYFEEDTQTLFILRSADFYHGSFVPCKQGDYVVRSPNGALSIMDKEWLERHYRKVEDVS